MNDLIIKLGNSLLQHGKFNDRVYLMKLAWEDYPQILGDLENLALQYGYTKIFAKVPAFAKGEFIAKGYRKEALIPRLYNGNEDVYFMGKYFSKEREQDTFADETKQVLKTAIQKAGFAEPILLPHDMTAKICAKSDAVAMAQVYQTVFETYPFPIHDPQYLAKTMDEQVIYFGLSYEDKLVALAATEMDLQSQSVEMTDFATLPAFRGKALAAFLLQWMEAEMTSKGIKVAYTIARAVSCGMNITFSRGGYGFSGTLINNTNISGNLENMNVWYKMLEE